jgi:hypothetical protein
MRMNALHPESACLNIALTEVPCNTWTKRMPARTRVRRISMLALFLHEAFTVALSLHEAF